MWFSRKLIGASCAEQATPSSALASNEFSYTDGSVFGANGGTGAV
jgi:hypothetical protein